jgi:molybdopterin-binding protein
MKLSARNQLKAKVATVNLGEVMSTVQVTLPDGQEVTAAITKASVEDLDVKVGDDVLVIIKSTEVMIAKED